MTLTLTPHQQDAVRWLANAIGAGTPLIALRGLAGTGKTTLIPHLRAALQARDIPSVVGSPTHRAAMILRRKGIHDAGTVHTHALMPYFTPEYVRALRWLGGQAECKLEREPQPDVDGLPWLLAEHCKANLNEARALQRQRNRPATRLLASVGIHGKDFFDGFGPKIGEGVLIIDEASMVGQAMLDLCQRAYKQIILVGDPGQLPPVKDQAMLATVEGFDLTDIHRQAAESPIIQLAYQARKGETFWTKSLTQLGDMGAGKIQQLSQADPAVFLDSPLIVQRNVTRLECTNAIRKALGYTSERLQVGEPLVCRSTSAEDRAEGFYNNGLYVIAAVNQRSLRQVTVADAEGEEHDIQIHLEELDGDKVHPTAIPFRFGYCVTAHTAQGGEWPIVYISLPDLVHYAKAARARKEPALLAQWTYTAITRAKDCLCFLTQHHFERTDPMATPPRPLDDPFATTLPADPVAQEYAQARQGFDQLTAGLEDADDIPEPATPIALVSATIEHAPETAQDAPGSTNAPAQVSHPSVPPVQQSSPAVTPQALGFLQWLQGEIRASFEAEALHTTAHVDRTFGFLKTAWEAQVRGDVQSAALLGEALTHLSQRGLTTTPPYAVSVQAVSPQGFPVTFTVGKRTMVEPEASAESGLLQVVPMLLDWLQEQGYTPPVPAEKLY